MNALALITATVEPGLNSPEALARNYARLTRGTYKLNFAGRHTVELEVPGAHLSTTLYDSHILLELKHKGYPVFKELDLLPAPVFAAGVAMLREKLAIHTEMPPAGYMAKARACLSEFHRA